MRLKLIFNLSSILGVSVATVSSRMRFPLELGPREAFRPFSLDCYWSALSSSGGERGLNIERCQLLIGTDDIYSSLEDERLLCDVRDPAEPVGSVYRVTRCGMFNVALARVEPFKADYLTLRLRGSLGAAVSVVASFRLYGDVVQVTDAQAASLISSGDPLGLS